MSHGAQSIGTDIPNKPGGQGDMEAITNGVFATVKQRLAAAVAMILNAVTVAAILNGPIIDVTEPCAEFESQSSDPHVLRLGERLEIDVSIEILAISKAA